MLVVGAASRDRTGADPRGWRIGGAVTYASLTLARLGVPVRALIGVDATASTASELDLLRDAGVAVRLVELARGPVFENIEGPAGRTQVCLSESDAISPDSLPTGWGRNDAAVVFGPVAGEIGDEWAGVPSARAFVALGWQGLLRILRTGEAVRRLAPAAGPLVDRADLVVASRDDFDQGLTDRDVRRLVRPSARLVVTCGAAGGHVAMAVPDGHGSPGARSRAWRRYRAIPSDADVDPTGAGDVFMAAMVAAWVDRSTIGRPPGAATDIRLASAAASLAIEAPGLLSVPTHPEVLRRMRRRSTRVEAS